MVHNQNIDNLEIREKHQFLRCQPYELPCQSLFFALITYKLITEDSICNIHKDQRRVFDLKNFEMVHLSNIRSFEGGDAEDDIEPWVDNLNQFGPRARFTGEFQLASKVVDINKALMEDQDMLQEFKKDTSASDMSNKADSFQGSTTKDTISESTMKAQNL